MKLPLELPGKQCISVATSCCKRMGNQANNVLISFSTFLSNLSDKTAFSFHYQQPINPSLSYFTSHQRSYVTFYRTVKSLDWEGLCPLPNWKAFNVKNLCSVSFMDSLRLQSHISECRWKTDHCQLRQNVGIAGCPTHGNYFAGLQSILGRGRDVNLLCHWKRRFYSPLCLHRLEVNRRGIYASVDLADV